MGVDLKAESYSRLVQPSQDPTQEGRVSFAALIRNIGSEDVQGPFWVQLSCAGYIGYPF